MDVSVVAPIYNEKDNLRPLHQELTSAMAELGGSYEILFIDDGSNDGSRRTLRALAATDSHVKVVCFRKNYGQTAAMHAGIQHAEGEIIVTIDGDRQNDPADIGPMIAKLKEGYDLVHGWRKDRKDAWLHRKLPSQIANNIISRVTGFPIHDLGCTLKVMRREIAQELELYGEMHRFIPILAHQRGARCVEVTTGHRPRVAGVTKYGIDRTLRVVLDLITVKYLTSYSASPMKALGKAGMACWLLAAGLLAGAAIAGVVSQLVIAAGFFAAAAVFTVGGMQLIGQGLLAEMSTRTYFDHQDRSYAVSTLINFGTNQFGEKRRRSNSLAAEPIDEIGQAVAERDFRVVAQ